MNPENLKLADLPGLGPKSAEYLSFISIKSTEQFMQADPFELYARLKQHTPGISLNMLYAMIGAQENIHWQLIARSRKEEILMRLDDMGIAPD